MTTKRIGTFVNLPESISGAISNILSQQESSLWVASAKKLHERYTAREKEGQENYVEDFSDVLAYLALRCPATYAQAASAFSQISEIAPSWKPRTILDIGTGPGTSVWAAKTVWKSLKTATAIDKERYFLSVGREILGKAGVGVDVSWQPHDLRHGLAKNETTYDLVVVANVLNELTVQERACARSSI